jgi:hypothetical protein
VTDVAVVTQGPNLDVTVGSAVAVTIAPPAVVEVVEEPAPQLFVQGGAPGPAQSSGSAEIGGIGVLTVKTYDARLPFDVAAEIWRVNVANVAGVGDATLRLVVNGTPTGPTLTVVSGSTYSTFDVAVAVPAGASVQLACLSVGGTPPTKLTAQLRWVA